MSNLTKNKRAKIRKVFSFVTALTTIFVLSGFAMIAPAGVANAVTPSDFGLKQGDTISATGSSDPDIYIVNDAGYKRLFLNPAIFNFYGHLGGFAKVKTVTSTVRDSFVTSGLFRNCETNDQKVYGVETTGEDTGVLHWVNTSGAQAVADDPNFFQKVFCINSNEFNWYAKGAEYTSVNQVPDYSRTGATPTPTGPISVSLASDNPAAGTLVKSQAAADLAHFQFSGNGVVTNLKFNRLGVSADTDLANVYLYDGVKRLTDAATVTNGQISFNDTSSTGLFSVSGTKTIMVRSDLSSSSGETVGVQLVSVNGNTVSVSGNLFTVANATLATTQLASSTTPSANSALTPADDVVVWQNTATVGTRYVWLKSLQVRAIGSVQVGDLQNFRLYVDGVMVGSSVAQTDSNGFVVFDLGSGTKLETGGRVLKVLANVVNGSSRNFTMSLRQAPDIFTVDSQYNQPIIATIASSGTFPVSAGQQTISTGSLTINKATTSPSGTVVKGASGVVLGKFELKATGEKMKVENLRVSFSSSNGGTTTGTNVGQLRNGALFVDGVQVGSTQSLNEDSWTTTYTEYSLGSSVVVEPGTTRILEVKADIYDADGTDNTTANDTITVNIAAGSSNVQRLTSLGYVSNSAKSANQLTVATGSLSAAKYSGYSNQSVVSPSNNVKVGHFTLTQSSSEDINVNTINFDSDASNNFIASDLTDMYIVVKNDSGSTVYTSSPKSTVSATASNSYSVNFLLAKNKTYQVEVWANIGSGETATETLSLDMDATGITTGSSTSSSTSAVIGQVITIQSGSLTYANGSLTSATLAAGGTTVDAYSFTVQPSYDDFTLEDVYVDISSTLASSSGAVANLTLLEDGTPVGSIATLVPTTGSASFSGVNRLLAQSAGTKTYTVRVSLANVGPGNNDTYGTVVVRLDGLKYHDSAGSVTTTNGLAPASYTGNDVRVVKAFPVFANDTTGFGTTPLAAGDNTLWKGTVTGNGGNVALYSLKFDITTTSGPTFNADETTYKLLANGNDITSLGTFASASATDLTTAGAHTGYVRFTFTNQYVVSSAVNLEFKGNLTAIGANYQAVSTKLANPKTTASAPDGAATIAVAAPTSATPSVVWSDLSSVGHSLTTDDWMDDYLVKAINSSMTRAISQ